VGSDVSDKFKIHIEHLILELFSRYISIVEESNGTKHEMKQCYMVNHVSNCTHDTWDLIVKMVKIS